MRFPDGELAETRPGSAKPASRNQKSSSRETSGLVCGAALRVALRGRFFVDIDMREGPGDLGGSRGLMSAKISWKTGPNISSQTALSYPEKEKMVTERP